MKVMIHPNCTKHWVHQKVRPIDQTQTQTTNSIPAAECHKAFKRHMQMRNTTVTLALTCFTFWLQCRVSHTGNWSGSMTFCANVQVNVFVGLVHCAVVPL